MVSTVVYALACTVNMGLERIVEVSVQEKKSFLTVMSFANYTLMPASCIYLRAPELRRKVFKMWRETLLPAQAPLSLKQ